MRRGGSASWHTTATLREARGTFADEAERLAARLRGVEKVPDSFSTLDMAAALASLPVYPTYVDPERATS